MHICLSMCILSLVAICPKDRALLQMAAAWKAQHCAGGGGLTSRCNLQALSLTGCERRFDNFFGNCTAMYGSHGCKVDIMAVHYYGCTTADLQRCGDPDSTGAELVLGKNVHLILLSMLALRVYFASLCSSANQYAASFRGLSGCCKEFRVVIGRQVATIYD